MHWQQQWVFAFFLLTYAICKSVATELLLKKTGLDILGVMDAFFYFFGELFMLQPILD